jgi:hypothetical protein
LYVAGTLHYMAPEVVKNPLKDHPDDFKNEQRYHYNMVVDSWAIGCLAFELLAGYPPFTANTQSQVVHNINHLEIAYPKRMSEDAISFMKAALERFPGERATTTELIKHPWIQQHMVRPCACVFAGMLKAQTLNNMNQCTNTQIKFMCCPAGNLQACLVRLPLMQRRGSSRHLTLQPQAPHPKAALDFSSGIAEAKKVEARRAADHGPKESIMAPF